MFLKYNGVLSTENITESNNSVSIYPNPATSQINLKSSKNIIQGIVLFNSLGKKIFSQKLNSMNYKLNTNQFVKGVYFLKIETKNRSTTKKLILK